MLRYLIVVGNTANSPHGDPVSEIRRRIHHSGTDWETAIDRPGFYACSVPNAFLRDSVLLLSGGQGVIFGSIFRSPADPDAIPTRPLQSISPSQTDVIFKSKGRSLISAYWGYYVAALCYPSRAAAVVARSPASPLACFHICSGGVNVFFSHLDDMTSLELSRLSINWDCIAAQVVGGDYLTSETAINEISALECGEILECGPAGNTKQVYWEPRKFLQDRSLDTFIEAARAVRTTTEYCVGCLASVHDRVLVNLSGGLDSSIVLHSLGRSVDRSSLTAVNYSSRGPGDERHFARMMAQSIGCRLVENERNDGLDLRRFFDCNRTVRPVLHFSAPDVEERNIALARELKASALFDGELGDNIFGSHPGPGILVESFRHHGLGRRSLSVAMDYAMLTKRSLWRTLASAVRERRDVAVHPDFNAAAEVAQEYGTDAMRSLILASRDTEDHCKNMGNRFVHPWLKLSRRIAPGSHMLLFGLIATTSTSYHSPFAKPEDPPQISPLLSQPLVEIALRIPSYLHSRSAQDRAVARSAFSEVLPPMILARGLGKGGPNLWAKDVISNNTTFLREFLLDGVLVQRRLVDRQKLETALSPTIARSTVIVGDIFAKLYMEAWLRKCPTIERTALKPI